MSGSKRLILVPAKKVKYLLQQFGVLESHFVKARPVFDEDWKLETALRVGARTLDLKEGDYASFHSEDYHEVHNTSSKVSALTNGIISPLVVKYMR